MSRIEFDSMDAMAKANGFEDDYEMMRLVTSADLSTPEKIRAFDRWKLEDGTKAGLLALAKPDLNQPC